MKKIFSPLLLIFLFLSCFTSSFAEDGVKFEHGNINEILAKARNNKKGPQLVFIDCFTQWCGPCKMVAKNVFPTKEAGDYFNTNFVNVKIDMETPEGKEFNKKYKVTAYPTFIILDLNGKEINRFVGATPETKWMINKVEATKDVTKSVGYLKSKFDKTGEKEDAVNYLNALYAINLYDNNITPFLEKNIALFDCYDIFYYDNWKFFRTAISPFGKSKKIAQYILDNKRYAFYGVGTALVNKRLNRYYIDQIVDYLQGKENLTSQEAELYINNIKLLLNDGDTFSSILCDIYKCRKENNFENELKILNGRDVCNLKENMELHTIINIFKHNKNINKEEWDSFTKRYKTFLDKNQTYMLRTIENR